MHAKYMTACAALVLLSGCGGGGGDPPANDSGAGGPISCTTDCPPGDSPPSGGGDVPPPSSGGGDDGGDGSSGGGDPPPQDPPVVENPPPNDPPVQEPPPGDTPPVISPPDSDFNVLSLYAPPNGATITTQFYMAVSGNGIRNAELLPPEGYVPIYSRFFPTPKGDTEWAGALEPLLLANGASYRFRISVFDVRPNTAGAREIVAMAPRTWTIDNGMNWQAGDRVVVTFPSIYPLKYDDTFLRNWLAVSNAEHEASFANEDEWAAFVNELEEYIPHHISFESAPGGLERPHRLCVDDRVVQSCREYITALVEFIKQ